MLPNPLPNMQHELFCNLVARGHSPEKAYTIAGYKENLKAAYTLVESRLIQKRIKEIQPYYDAYYKDFEEE